MSIELVMPSSHLILCRPLLLLSPIPPSIRVFSNESTLRMRWPKYWSFSLSLLKQGPHPIPHRTTLLPPPVRLHFSHPSGPAVVSLPANNKYPSAFLFLANLQPWIWQYVVNFLFHEYGPAASDEVIKSLMSVLMCLTLFLKRTPRLVE